MNDPKKSEDIRVADPEYSVAERVAAWEAAADGDRRLLMAIYAADARLVKAQLSRMRSRTSPENPSSGSSNAPEKAIEVEPTNARVRHDARRDPNASGSSR
ncbi:MAG: hypothetical protein IT375_25840 [Polyangiaceae bacterium]|nr:hypothetical protein [Polyangiaceae bacterium]